MNNLNHKITALLEERPIPVQKIVEEIAFASIDTKDEDFEVLIKLAELDDLMDGFLAAPAMVFLPAWGEKGIDVLISLAFDPNRKIKTQARAIESLLAISLGRCPEDCDMQFLPDNWKEIKKYSVSPDLKAYCSILLREQLLVSLSDQERKRLLFYNLGMMGMMSGFKEGDDTKFDHWLDLTVDSHLVLNINLLGQFESLLDSGPEREEDLQRFLTDHPVLIDPFVSVLYTKQELGSDFITDFIIRRMNDQYVLVEIENSTDPLFTKNGSFTAELNTAIGQVRDFQAWVSENIAYAQKKLPYIKYPEGLVVIGRRKDLEEIEIKRLVEENFSRRGHIKITTYDDLLDQGKIVHRNLIERPEVLKSKDTKSI